MATNYILTIGLIGACSAALKRIASRPVEIPEIEEDWSNLPDDVYLNDALYERMEGRA